MKIFFISSTAVIVFWMVTKFKTSYDAENDKFHGDGSFMVRSHTLRPVAMADTVDLGSLVMTRPVCVLSHILQKRVVLAGARSSARGLGLHCSAVFLTSAHLERGIRALRNLVVRARFMFLRGLGC